MKYIWEDSASVNFVSTQTKKIFIQEDSVSVNIATMTKWFKLKLLPLKNHFKKT